MGDELVQADAVEFAFKKPALKDFSIRTRQGELTLLLGLNGAGKSTALSLLAGVRKPAHGRIRICGGNPRHAKTRRHLWWLEETAMPLAHLSAQEAVRFHLGLFGKSGPWRPAAEKALERVGLLDVRKSRASSFSKGMRRRLELACLIATDPAVWLLDEPQSGLDPEGLRLLRDLCLEAKDRGRAIVMASHALSDVPRLADEVIVLTAGETTYSGRASDLMETIGAANYVVKGGSSALDEALRALVAAHHATLVGPEVPAEPLEDFLYRSKSTTQKMEDGPK